MKLKEFIFLLCLGLVFIQCKTESTGTDVETEDEIESAPIERKNVRIPPTNRDSATAYILQQLMFGPRVPNSEGHQKTKDWIVAKAKSFGFDVIEQNFQTEDYKGTSIDATNIIASINPEHEKRVIVAAHWDTRFMADRDPNRIEDPIAGADDGASGVAGLLEIARTIQQNPIDLGVDLIFFDVEDQGNQGGELESWCLGSQYWANNPHVDGYDAKFGILLDMIGAKGAIFQTENLNGVFEREKVTRITKLYDRMWAQARTMGRGNMFMDRKIGPVTDDHYFVNKLTDIPMIDIIHRPIESETGFGAHWHTHGDEFSVIDKNVLGVVIQVVTAALYKESGNNFIDF